MKIHYFILVMAMMIISGCVSKLESVTMRDPQTGNRVKCEGSTEEIKKCAKELEDKGYDVKVLVLKDKQQEK